ncbi:MAG: lipoyl(octanoyl) transferase LipB [Phycisphaerae bacterium]|nr:lipoyl(octanoyl) transferase LipB [Phycisphaerae bacterium]
MPAFADPPPNTRPDPRPDTPAVPLDVRDLGRVPYADALELQRATHAALVASRETGPAPMTLFLLEHDPPVITVSRRPGASANLLASPELLAAHGVTVAETDRGGDITYHGPGQLVAYPILDLNRLGLRIHSYMRLLEEIVVRTLARHGIQGHRDHCATGVWVGGNAEADACAVAGGRKICAMGVRVSRWATMHGLALNVSTNLDHFGLIVPCGLVGRPVTSIAHELGPARAAPTIERVKRDLAEEFARALAECPVPAD